MVGYIMYFDNESEEIWTDSATFITALVRLDYDKLGYVRLGLVWFG